MEKQPKKKTSNVSRVTQKVLKNKFHFFLEYNQFKIILGEHRVTTPTAPESTLPWKRDGDEKEENGAMRQTEFPSWANNKEYLAYNSPSATFLGNFNELREL